MVFGAALNFRFFAHIDSLCGTPVEAGQTGETVLPKDWSGI